jgi:hypothetical protein
MAYEPERKDQHDNANTGSDTGVAPPASSNASPKVEGKGEPGRQYAKNPTTKVEPSHLSPLCL